MKEQINSPTSRESGMPIEGEGRFDLHTSDLMSLEELKIQQRREAFERQALGVIAPERRPLERHEQLGQLNAGVMYWRGQRLSRDNFDKAA
jgi:hypothetical protein